MDDLFTHLPLLAFVQKTIFRIVVFFYSQSHNKTHINNQSKKRSHHNISVKIVFFHSSLNYLT